MRDSHKRSLGNLRRGISMDIDQIHAALADPEARRALEQQPVDIEQIGMAQHYCVHCAQYFETDHALTEHRRGSRHKKRVKLLKETPYSHAEADMAAGVNASNSRYALRRNPATTKQAPSASDAKDGDVVMAQ